MQQSQLFWSDFKLHSEMQHRVKLMIHLLDLRAGHNATSMALPLKHGLCTGVD